MNTILDIHTHHPAPQPNAVVCTTPDNFNPIEGQIYSVGIHPWDIQGEISEETWEKLAEAARHPQVGAIGECGIDLVKGGPLFKQMQVMRRQIDLSEEIGKPLVIHCVHAHDIVIGLRRDLKPSQDWLIHGFRGKPTIATMYIDAGFRISFGANFNHDSVGKVPNDRIFAETDESATPIEEIITQLSALKGEDLTPIIARNSSAFLKLN